MGERRVEDGLDLAGLDVRLLDHGRSTTAGRVRYRIARLLRRGFPPITRQFADVGAGVIHVHFGTDAVDLWPQVRALRIPLLVTLHGYDINIHRAWWEAGHGGIRRRTYPDQLLRMASDNRVGFIAVSDAIRRRAIEAGIPGAKVQVRYIGIDTRRFAPGGLPLAQRDNCVLFVGRLVEKKGAACLVRAFAKVRDRVPDAGLVVVGDGPLRGDLERLASDLAVPVRFLGAMDSDGILRQMHRARAFCLPSVTAGNGDAEGLPIVVLEAQAAGVPVITSARGAVGEAVLDGRTGHAFEEFDVDRLADLIVATLEHDEDATALAIRARRHVETLFDLAGCTRDLERSFDEAADAWTPGRDAR